MKILILGAGGFIGSHLANTLLEEGFDIVGVDISDEKLDADVIKKIEFYRWDVRKHHDDLSACIAQADLVIDLIAYANPAIYIQRPLDVVQLNFFENLFVAQQCIDHSKRLIQFSTCEVYGMSGGSNEPFSEDDSPLTMGPVRYHRWIYACGKQYLERILHAYGLEGQLDYTIIRPFNFIGPRFDYLIRSRTDGTPRVLALFLSALLQEQPLYLVDGGKQTRSFTDIRDALDAMVLIIKSGEGDFNCQICNIGNPNNEISMEHLARKMIDLYEELSGTTFRAGIRTVSGEEFYGEGYQDCDRRLPDISKLKAVGWMPKYTLDDALRSTMTYYLERNIKATERL